MIGVNHHDHPDRQVTVRTVVSPAFVTVGSEGVGRVSYATQPALDCRFPARPGVALSVNGRSVLLDSNSSTLTWFTNIFYHHYLGASWILVITWPRRLSSRTASFLRSRAGSVLWEAE